MSRPVIIVEDLGKEYVLGAREQANQTFREMLATAVTAPIRRLRGEIRSEERIWALKNVSFEVKQGEIVGIIGRNGAGKSTLLKILSRITEPTEGRVVLRGRVASLLEVGTGFHQELTGRENIFLNGAILGMTQREIRKKFDDIVAFAEVEKFLDTPVKHYSSGMYVRLAFAVAAHLEPEILIVDEVLAVGDAAFQQKCLAKMEDVTGLGRTVLFVSHQLPAVSSLCSRTIVLEKGQISFVGDTADAISHYLVPGLERTAQGNLPAHIPRSGNGKIVLEKVWISSEDGREQETIVTGQSVVFNFKLLNMTKSDLPNVSVGVGIHDHFGSNISILYSDYCGRFFRLGTGETIVTCTIQKFPLSEGRYFIHARVLSNGEEADFPLDHVTKLSVENGRFYDSAVPFHSGIGIVLLSGQWSAKG
jgi:lipopolysaccharide transport system ATP-binding protein